MKGMKASEHLIYYMFAYGLRIFFGVSIILFAVLLVIAMFHWGPMVSLAAALFGIVFIVALLITEYHLRNYRRKWLESQQSTAKSE